MKKITVREKILIVFAFLFIAFVLFDNFFLSPLKEETKKINAEIAEKEALIVSLSAKQSGINTIEDHLNDMLDEYADTTKAFPEKWNDAEMLKFIEETIGDDLTKRNLSFNGLNDRGSYVSGSFTISVSGTYEAFTEMLHDFENAKYFNTITYVLVPSYNTDTETEVQFQFTICFYALSR